MDILVMRILEKTMNLAIKGIVCIYIYILLNMLKWKIIA
jgi:hypothetical protein